MPTMMVLRQNHTCLLQDFGGEVAYAPFHEATFRHQLPQSSLQELSAMQQMLDWRATEIHNELALLDAADKPHGAPRHSMLSMLLSALHGLHLNAVCIECSDCCRQMHAQTVLVSQVPAIALLADASTQCVHMVCMNALEMRTVYMS